MKEEVWTYSRQDPSSLHLVRVVFPLLALRDLIVYTGLLSECTI